MARKENCSVCAACFYGTGCTVANTLQSLVCNRLQGAKMNIWEYGKKQAENSKEELSNKQFGIEHWYALLDTHELYFVEFDQAVQDLIVPMGWLHSGPRDKYEIMQKQFNLVMSYEDYQLHCKLIHDTLVDYDYKMFRLIDDPLFKLKEFGQLALLNQEIYQNF